MGVLLEFDPSKLVLKNNSWSTLEDWEGASCRYDYDLRYDGKSIWRGEASIDYHGWSNVPRGPGHCLQCSLSDDKMTFKTRRYGGDLLTEEICELSVKELIKGPRI